ncbi:MAG TPA: glycosyltransferase family 39 protein [Thermoanaerobaculia bacterium]|nr:glycosyltransferase family 39 protein [Thermoanaerobaculia bacterium]
MRLAVVAVTGFSTVRFGDARAYLNAAETIAREGRYPARTDVFFFRPPGYPAFLAIATLGRPGSIPRAKLATAAVGALCAPLLAALSARIFRRRRLAIATGVAAALHPAFLVVASDVQSEPLFLALLLAAGILLLVATDRPSTTLALAAGGLLALAALTRSSALALAPFLAAPLFDGRYPRRARAHIAAAALVGFLFLLAPWTLRNALLFGEFLPVNDAAGNAFYQGNSDWTVRFYRVRTREQYLAWMKAFDEDMQRRTLELDRTGRGSPGERSRAFARQAFQERRSDPAGWAKLFLQKAWDWLRPYPNPLFWQAPAVAAAAAYNVLLYFLAAAGFAVAPRRGVRAFALLFLGVTFLAHVVLIVVWRYRIPYWDPVLLLYGVFGAGTLLSAWRRRSPKSPARATA